MRDDNPVPYALVLILAIMLLASGYAYLVKMRPPVRTVAVEEDRSVPGAVEESSDGMLVLKVFYPSAAGLVIEEREVERVFSQKKILKAAINEFFKGPAGAETRAIPKGTVLLAAFIGSNGTAYLDLSEELRRNFNGDTMDEYLLLKGLYETTITNIKADDVKVLVQGKEIDSVGGHFAAHHPLKQIVSREIVFERK